jgi:uncharacterized membrane protein
MSKINRELVLSLFLAFVVGYFGISEITSPEKWVHFVPSFFGTGSIINTLVLIHGIILVLCGVFLVINWKKRMVATLLSLMLLSIVFSLFSDGGLTPTTVRDIGLFGMALSLTFKN